MKIFRYTLPAVMICMVVTVGSGCSKQDVPVTEIPVSSQTESVPVELDTVLLPIPAGKIADGRYTVEVSLSGGTGRVRIESPAEIIISEGKARAVIAWSSPYYEYMQMDGTFYYPVKREENAVFEIPVRFDEDIPVTAQTIAMSQPHEIEYILRFDSNTLKITASRHPLVTAAGFAAAVLILIIVFLIWKRKRRKMKLSDMFVFMLSLCMLSGCSSQKAADGFGLGNGWEPETEMLLEYAENFSVDYYQGDLALIHLSDGSRFLVVPEGGAVPEGIDDDIVMLQQPVRQIYLVATSSMCLFDALDALDHIALSGTRAEDWYIENARAAMEAGDIRYAGKYSAPDYEQILAQNCGLAVQSTMINHTPEVKEKLEDLGIPVLIDLSSYETHPLGRTEWLKLYGVLTGKEELAERLFAEQAAYLNELADQESTGKTVAFFYISSSGYAVTRKSGDYITKMIEYAGGDFIFKGLGDPDSAMGTVNLEMEEFYAVARDADYLIYNSTIGGELNSMDELITKNKLLMDFKAVQNGNVWCTEKNLFQETTRLGLMISDIHRMLTEENDDIQELNFLYRLQ